MTIASQVNSGHRQKCDWSDCPCCPIAAQDERAEGTDASNWQSALTTSHTRSHVSKRASPKTQDLIRGKKNTRGIFARKAARGASRGTPQRAVDKELVKGRNGDAQQEYWEVAELLGLVRRA